MEQRVVSVYERLGFKSDIMSLLPPTTLYLLSAPSMPDEAIEQVQQQLDGRKPISVATVQQVIKEAKQRVVEQDGRISDEGFIEGELVGHAEGGGGAESVGRAGASLSLASPLSV